MTSTELSMEMYDITAKSDLTSAADDKQSFSTLTSFNKETPVWPKYATLESDRFLLDGTMQAFPDDMREEWGLWSQQLSDGNGMFAAPVILTLAFEEEHSSFGLTLHFDKAVGEYSNRFLVQWFDSQGLEITRLPVLADSPEYFVEKLAENYKKIRITFYSTNIPQRYLKLSGIEFGTTLTFKGADIISASLIEEINPISAELPIGKLEVQIYSQDAKFSILNPQGIYQALQKKQRVTVTEWVDGEAIPMGVHYLDDWNNETETVSNLTFIDAIGLLDTMPHPGGIYNGTLRTVAAEVLSGFSYKIADDVMNVPLVGWLGTGTRRTALQQVAFAAGIVIDCTRDGAIKLYRPEERTTGYIRYARKKHGNSKVSMKPLVTGVRISAHSYVKGGAVEELYREELAAGTYTIALNEPAYSYTVQGGTLLEEHPNYIRLAVGSRSEVIVRGIKYLHNIRLIEKGAEKIPPNSEENIIKVEDATLVSPDNAYQLAERLLGYYKNRHELTFDFLIKDEKLIQKLLVDSLHKEKVLGRIESMDIDLTGGFWASAILSGLRIDTRWRFYTGEGYTDEGGLI